MMQNNINVFNNPYYVNSFNFSPLKTRVFITFIASLINNNFNKNNQKDIKVIISELLIETTSHNKDYLTLKDLDKKEENDQVYAYLKKLIPNVFQDGILNFELLKQHLGQSENIVESNVFGLYWNGKNKASINSRTPLNWKTLKPLRDQSLNFDEAQNVIIEGDNLEALKILQKAYFNQVDVIYIDPPYNTGLDFVYDDNYSQSIKEYKEINNLVDEEGLKTTTNQKTSGRFHTNWLNMIYSRLVLARSLLKDDGVIFISIDDNEQARLKIVCDEIFGEDNFITNFIWQKKSGGGMAKHIYEGHEYVLAYSKNKAKIQLGVLTRKIKKEIKKDINGEYFLETDYVRKVFGKSINKEHRNCFYEELHIYKSKEQIDNYEKELKKGNLELVYSEKHKKHFIANKIYLENGMYWKTPYSIISGVWTADGNNELLKIFNNLELENSKPISLIKTIINMNRKKNSLVLDFFAGSGTTGQAVMELNQEDGGDRKYILVQLPEKAENDSEFKTICDITRARIERSIAKYQYNDKGFKYFKVVPTNFQLWQATTQDDNQIIEKQLDLFSQSNNKQNDYEAILYELMLKSGMRLDWNIKDRMIDDHQFWIDDQIDNLFFLKPQNLEQVLEIIKQVLKEKTNDSDTKVYINESYFQGQASDQNKLNLWEQIKQFNKQQNKQIKLVVI